MSISKLLTLFRYPDIEILLKIIRMPLLIFAGFYTYYFAIFPNLKVKFHSNFWFHSQLIYDFFKIQQKILPIIITILGSFFFFLLCFFLLQLYKMKKYRIKISDLSILRKTSKWINGRVLITFNIHMDGSKGREKMRKMGSISRAKYFKREFLKSLLYIDREIENNPFFRDVEVITAESIKMSKTDLKNLKNLGIQVYTRKWYQSFIQRIFMTIFISHNETKNGSNFFQQVKQNLFKPLNGFIVTTSELREKKNAIVEMMNRY